jgi:hypothetical protein
LEHGGQVGRLQPEALLTSGEQGNWAERNAAAPPTIEKDERHIHKINPAG